MKSGTSSVPRILRGISPKRISLVYVGIGLFLLFAIWTPDTFLTSQTWKSILNQEAITALVALGLLIPLSAGAFDLSVGYVIGLSGMLAAWLIGEHSVGPLLAIVLVLLAGVLVGVINGFLVVGLRINSFIATLAFGSILLAVIGMISGNEQITGLPASFSDISLTQVGGISLPVFYLVALALVFWYVLEHTPIGRRLYATGGGEEAARLAGVRTSRIIFCSFIVAAAMSALAGILLLAQLTTASPTTGPSYLLPAFAAAFLGSTQISPGRFNVVGTLLAVYVLAIGVKGLQLVGAAFWVPDLFNGVALIIAVGVSGALETFAGLRWRRIRSAHVHAADGDPPRSGDDATDPPVSGAPLADRT
jgi:ribose transport system permease protein